MKLRPKILIVLILAAVVAVIWLVFRRPNGSKRAVEVYKQQLLAQGEKLAVSELVPVPPEKSFDNAQSFLGAIGMSRPAYAPPMMMFISPGRALVAWQQEILPNTTSVRTATAEKWTNIWPSVTAELRANSAALNNLQSAVDIPVLYFNLDYSKGFEILLPHLAPLKQAEILVADAAIAALHDRRNSEALTNLQTATSLVRIYQPEPFLISHLVRIAIANIAARVTWEFLQSDQWTDAQLAGLQSDWEQMEFFNACEPAYLMERAESIEFFSRARKSRDPVANMGMPVPSNSPSSQGFLDSAIDSIKPALERVLYTIWKRRWSYDEEMYYLQNHAAGLKAIRETRSTGAAAPALRELQTAMSGITRLHTNAIAHFMAGMGSDWIGTSLRRFAEAETARRMLVTAIALKRYHLRRGNYPPDLKALVPEFLGQVPQDLMDGKPLRYRATSDGNYLLYSVGDDSKDDNGDATPMRGASGQLHNWLKGRDIVWPRAATAEEIANALPKVSPAKTPTQQRIAPEGTNATGR